MKTPAFKWRLLVFLLALMGVMAVAVVLFRNPPPKRKSPPQMNWAALESADAPSASIMHPALDALSNDDVEVDGGYDGLRVNIKSLAAEEFKCLGPQANWALQQALADPDRFAAAHIVLTQINYRPYNISGSHWNEMQIDLFANGEVDFHAEQIPHLQEFWRNRLGKNRSADVEGQTPIAVAPAQ